MSPKRRRRGLRAFVIIIVVLGGLLFAADRIGESVAENQLAKAAAQEAAKYDVRADNTSAEIGGFAFLPQVATGDFSKITVTMQRPSYSAVAAEDLGAVMTGIHIPRELLTGSSGTVTVDTTDVRLRLSPGSFAKLAARTTGLGGLSLKAGDGKLLATLKLGGIDATVPVRPQVVNGRLRLGVDDLPSELPSAVRHALTSALSKGIVLPRLPFGATLKAVAVEGQSIVLTATATNLQLKAGA